MAFSSELSNRYLELARHPVSEECFVGEDIRFSSEFESIESELAKAQSLHVVGQVDWGSVRELAEGILRNRSKDLRVASWLTWALHQCESFAGLVAGVGLLEWLCSEHWAQVHPQKSRTRSAAIGWLVSRLDQVLTDVVPVKDQLPLFRGLVQSLEALDLSLNQHLGHDAPLILPIRRRLANMIQRAEEGKSEVGAVGIAVAQAKQVANQLFSPGSPIENEKDAHKALRAQQEGAQPLCAWWLRQRATDLRALRLNRTLMWLSIDSVPERNAEGVTALRSLPPDKLKDYRDRLERSDYADLLVDIESSIARSPFWFDGQRMAWECLQGMKAEMAMREVEIHFALFLQRLPGVVELQFHDGLPFADAQTRSWISGQVMPHLQAPASPRKAQSAESSPAWEAALQDVMPTLRRDGLKSAVQLLKQGLQRSQGGRERFFWQLSLARLCFQAKKYDLAKSQLETLDRQLHASGLQAWEPELALDVLHLLHSCFELMPQSQTVREHKEDIYRRLCHLDLEVVLE